MTPDPEPNAELAIDVSAQGPAAVVSVRGDIDLHTAPQLRARLDEVLEEAPTAPRIVVDLTGVDFLDSSALGVLVGANRSALQRGGWFAVAGARPNIVKVFEITRLTEVFPLFDSPAAALA